MAGIWQDLGFSPKYGKHKTSDCSDMVLSAVRGHLSIQCTTGRGVALLRSIFSFLKGGGHNGMPRQFTMELSRRANCEICISDCFKGNLTRLRSSTMGQLFLDSFVR